MDTMLTRTLATKSASNEMTPGEPIGKGVVACVGAAVPLTVWLNSSKVQ